MQGLRRGGEDGSNWTFAFPSKSFEAGEDERTDDFNPDEPLYVQILGQINDLEEPYMNINAGHVKTFDEDLYRQLICYPQEVIPTMDMAVNEMFFEKYPDTVLNHQIQVRGFFFYFSYLL